MLRGMRVASSHAQATAVIRFTIPREEIQNVMMAAVGEVLAAVMAQKAGPVGPVFSYHYRLDPKVFDFEVGVPVNAEFKPTGRVIAGTLPAAKVAIATYQGGYEGLGNAWGEFNDWVIEQELSPRESLWECYAKGPESSPDPNTWETILFRPLAG